MTDICKKVTTVEFIIIKRCKSKFKSVEDLHIKNNIGNPLMVNRSYSAYNGGCKRTPEQYKRKIDSITYKKKVAQLSKSGEVINIFESITEAVKATGVINVSWATSKLGRSSGGFLFRKVSENGDLIIPPSKWVRTLPKRENIKHRKAVHQINSNNEIVATYSFYKEAADAVGCSGTHMHRVIKKTNRCQRARGFYFNYATEETLIKYPVGFRQSN